MDLEEIKSRINPQYQDVRGTESYERKWLCDEIDRLREEIASCTADLAREVSEGNRYMLEAAQLREQLAAMKGGK